MKTITTQQQDFDPLLVFQRFGVQSRSLGDLSLFGYTNLSATIWWGGRNWRNLWRLVVNLIQNPSRWSMHTLMTWLVGARACMPGAVEYSRHTHLHAHMSSWDTWHIAVVWFVAGSLLVHLMKLQSTNLWQEIIWLDPTWSTFLA